MSAPEESESMGRGVAHLLASLTVAALLLAIAWLHLGRIPATGGEAPPRWNDDPGPRGAIAGRVVWDDSGAPVAGVHVLLVRNAHISRATGDAPSVRSDGAGRFRFTRLPAAPYMLVARWPGRHEAYGNDPSGSGALALGPELGLGLLEHARPGDEALDLRLQRTQAVRGRVLDLEGAPVERFEILATWRGPAWLDERRARWFEAADGGFTLAALRQGRWEFAARAPGLATARPVEVHVGPATPPLELRVAPATSIEGRVVRPDGTPVAGAIVDATRRVLGSWMACGAASSGDGSFRVTLPSGGLWRVRAAATDFAASETIEVELDGETRVDPILLRLRAQSLPGGPATSAPGADPELRGEAVLRGRVLDPRGLPAIDALVRLEGPGRSTQKAARAALCDASGTFELPGLAPGAYVLRARPPVSGAEGRLAAETRREIDVPAAGARVELQLPPAGAVSGTVSRPDAAPVPGAFVVARAAGFAPRAVECDGRGRFRIDGLPPGSWSLLASDGFRLVSAETSALWIQGDETTLDLVLRPGTRVAVRMESATGAPIAAALRVLDGAGIEWLDGGEEALSLHRVGPLPPGHYRFVAGGGGTAAEVRVELTGEPELALALRPGG